MAERSAASEPEPTRRSYLQTLGTAGVLPSAVLDLGTDAGGDAAAAEAAGVVPAQERAREYPGDLSDWSYAVTDTYVEPGTKRVARLDFDDVSYLEDGYTPAPEDPSARGGSLAERETHTGYLYAPRAGDLDHEAADRPYGNVHPEGEAGDPRHYGWRYLVTLLTRLELHSVLWVPFIGSGYWRFTFSLSGYASGAVQNNFAWWDVGDPDTTGGGHYVGGDDHDDHDHEVPHDVSEEYPEWDGASGHLPQGKRFAHRFVNPDVWRGRDRIGGFGRHGVFLYQPSSRRPGELAIVTAAPDGGRYGRGVPRPEAVASSQDNPVVRALLEASASTARGEIRDGLLVRGETLAGTALRRAVSSSALALIDAAVDVGYTTSRPADVRAWEQFFAPAQTDTWDLASWRYAGGNARNPVSHQRLFSVDVPPIEDERAAIAADPTDTDWTARWAEFRISDFYARRDRASVGAHQQADPPSISATNELSVRVPKLPTPENRDLFDHEIVPYCHVDDTCMYVAKDVEPTVCVATREMPTTDIP